MNKISGMICLVVGGMPISWGYNMSHAVSSEINNLVKGSRGDKPMLLYIGGATLLIVRFGQIAWKGK